MVQIGGKGNLEVRETTCDWKVFEFNPKTSYESFDWGEWFGENGVK